MKNRQQPGIEPGASDHDLAVSALPPELWPPGDGQSPQFSDYVHVHVHVHAHVGVGYCSADL